MLNRRSVSYVLATTSTPTATPSARRSPHPAHGTASAPAGGYIYYTPDSGYSGIDTITYTIRDTHGLMATGCPRAAIRNEREPAAGTHSRRATR